MAYDGTAYDRDELDTLLIGLARSTRFASYRCPNTAAVRHEFNMVCP